MKNRPLILLVSDAAPGLPPAGLAPATATQHVADLKQALADADGILQVLLKDPHIANCPFVAAIRSGVVNGALDRLQHLESWLSSNPVPPPANP